MDNVRVNAVETRHLTACREIGVRQAGVLAGGTVANQDEGTRMRVI